MAERKAPTPPPGEPGYTGPRQVKPTPPPAPPKPKRVNTCDPAVAIRAAILQKLASGASYEVFDLTRAVRAALPDVDPLAVSLGLDGLRTDGQIRRIPVGDSWRYQLLAKRGSRREAGAA